MLESGMRREEVFRIRPENVHISQGYLFNPFGKTKAAKRRVPLTLAAKTVLRRRIDTKEVYLFPCETDATRPIPKVNNAHDRAVRDSKLKPFRLYDLRHTWATRAAMSGIDLVTLAAMLGHSRIQMVLRYAHPTRNTSTRPWSALSSLLRRNEPNLEGRHLRPTHPRSRRLDASPEEQITATRYSIRYRGKALRSGGPLSY
jgi:integrase